MPLVSVIIPTHNRRDLVCEAVASALAQRDGDGGGDRRRRRVDDGTAAALGALGGAHPLHRCSRRAASRRRATRRAAGAGGAWLAFLDSDDLWRPDKLARQLAFHARMPALRGQPDGRDLDPQRSARQSMPPPPQAGRRHLRAESCALRGEPVGGDAAPRAVRRAGRLRRGAAGVRGLRSVAAARRAREPVGLLDEPLVVKRGGHADQLSRALLGHGPLPRRGAGQAAGGGRALADHAAAAAVATLRTKCAVLAQGRAAGAVASTKPSATWSWPAPDVSRGVSDVGARRARLRRRKALQRRDARALAGAASRRSRRAARRSPSGCGSGENQLRDVLDDLAAIGSRHGRAGSPRSCESDELRAVLGRRLGRNEAIKALKQSLRRLRYPQLSAAEQRLADARQARCDCPPACASSCRRTWKASTSRSPCGPARQLSCVRRREPWRRRCRPARSTRCLRCSRGEW